MRLISLQSVIGTILLACCMSSRAVEPATGVSSKGSAATPPASCEVDKSQYTTMAYTDQGDPKRYLRGNPFRAVSDAYKFVTPVANDVSRLWRRPGGGGGCTPVRVLADCSNLVISSGLQMTLTDTTGIMPPITALQLTPNQATGTVDYLKSDPWPQPDGSITFFVYFLDEPAPPANGSSAKQVYKDYKIEVFKGADCPKERPDYPGNITNVPPPTPPTVANPGLGFMQTDTTQGHEGHN